MLRRFVIAVLFLVLPPQLVWAAAAPYCGHETPPAAAQHFGHHEHEHQGADEAAAADQTGEVGGAYHLDCESCHLGAGTTLPPAAAIALDAAPCAAVHAYRLPGYRSHTPSAPERPDIAELTPAARFAGGVVSGALRLA